MHRRQGSGHGRQDRNVRAELGTFRHSVAQKLTQVARDLYSGVVMRCRGVVSQHRYLF